MIVSSTCFSPAVSYQIPFARSLRLLASFSSLLIFFFFLPSAPKGYRRQAKNGVAQSCCATSPAVRQGSALASGTWKQGKGKKQEHSQRPQGKRERRSDQWVPDRGHVGSSPRSALAWPHATLGVHRAARLSLLCLVPFSGFPFSTATDVFITFRCTFFFLIVHAVSLHGAARLRVGSFLSYLVLFLGCIYDRMKLVVWCRVGFTLGSTGLLFFPFLFSYRLRSVRK